MVFVKLNHQNYNTHFLRWKDCYTPCEFLKFTIWILRFLFTISLRFPSSFSFLSLSQALYVIAFHKLFPFRPWPVFCEKQWTPPPSIYVWISIFGHNWKLMAFLFIKNGIQEKMEVDNIVILPRLKQGIFKVIYLSCLILSLYTYCYREVRQRNTKCVSDNVYEMINANDCDVR